MRIGFIGLGVMGLPMAGHLQSRFGLAGVHTRTRARAADLLARQVSWFPTGAELARCCDVLCTMVGYPRDVEEVYLGPHGLLSHASPGTLCLDFTTTQPSLSGEIARLGAERGIACLDCPVSGGDVGARQATLSIMVGGDPAAFERARQLLEVLGKNLQYLGGPGSGQHCKMANQITIAGTMVGVCEALLYGIRAGLHPETMLAAIRPGAAGCWTLENLAPRMVKGRFEPGFMVDHFIKDMGIALEEAERMGLVLPGLSLVRQLYLATRNGGWGQQGTHALYLALERLAGAKGAIR